MGTVTDFGGGLIEGVRDGTLGRINLVPLKDGRWQASHQAPGQKGWNVGVEKTPHAALCAAISPAVGGMVEFVDEERWKQKFKGPMGGHDEDWEQEDLI